MLIESMDKWIVISIYKSGGKCMIALSHMNLPDFIYILIREEFTEL